MEPQPIYRTAHGNFRHVLPDLLSKTQEPDPGLGDLQALQNINILLGRMDNYPTTDALRRWVAKKISDIEQYS